MIGSFILFQSSLSSGFVSDDWHWLWVAHERRSALPDLSANIIGERTGGSYNPVSSLMVNSLFQAFGLRPRPFHAASIVLHGVNAFLVYLLAVRWRKLFPGAAYGRAAPFVAGVLFLIWPTHVEAVAWMASVPHVLATFFFLFSVIFYLQWRGEGRWSYFVISLISALLAFGSKEIALSLPIVILILEALYQLTSRKRLAARPFVPAFCFFAIALIFVIMRWQATGLWLGTYADQGLIIRVQTWAHTFLTFFEEMLTLGTMRQAWSAFYFDEPRVTILISVIPIAVLVLFTLRRNLLGIGAFLLFFVATILPYIPLGFNRLSAEGERYTYLPSVFFILVVSLVLARLPKPFVRFAVSGALVAVCIFLAAPKIDSWHIASAAAQDIVADFQDHVSPSVMRYVFVLLPDTIGGAHVFRNNIVEAIRLTSADAPRDMVQIPVYLQMDASQYRDEVVRWRSDDRGYFAETAPGMLMITGVDRAETGLLTYELWGYDYDVFSSDMVRILLSEELRQELIAGTAKMLTWDRGALREVPYDPEPS
ncbi:MAG: hypothetical protein AAB490_00330 [Patescibacteria group bacterium]